MEDKLCNLMVFSLNYFELTPFIYFLNSAHLPPINLEQICDPEQDIVQCVISIPIDANPAFLKKIWAGWKEEYLLDYAIQN